MDAFKEMLDNFFIPSTFQQGGDVTPKTEELPTIPSAHLIREALSHLMAAKVQFCDTDDAIIREHVLIAYALLAVVERRLP